jgi:hypothetical protein
MRIATTVPTQDPRTAADAFAGLEGAGYDTGFPFESKHDPFLPLAAHFVDIVADVRARSAAP